MQTGLSSVLETFLSAIANWLTLWCLSFTFLDEFEIGPFLKEFLEVYT